MLYELLADVVHDNCSIGASIASETFPTGGMIVGIILGRFGIQTSGFKQ